MRINREQFNKWLRALKSGRYKQTTGTLNDSKGYCCLGVACKVLIPKNKLQMEEDIDENTGETIKTKYIFGSLPRDQKYAPAWLKEISEIKITNEYDEIEKEELTDLNDNKKWNFKMIAKALEKAYPERKKSKLLVKKKK